MKHHRQSKLLSTFGKSLAAAGVLLALGVAPSAVSAQTRGKTARPAARSAKSAATKSARTSKPGTPGTILSAKLATKALHERPGNSLRTMAKAEKVLGRKLSSREKVAVLAAHNEAPLTLGKKINWSQIRQKARHLRKVFPKAERKRLMDQGVVGDWTVMARRDGARLIYDNKVFESSTQVQQYAADKMGRYWKDVKVRTNDSGYVVLPKH
jgi:hypothetical protein